MSRIEQQLAALKVVPVIVIHDARKAVKLAQTLIENGLHCAEITFRTEAAAESIRSIKAEYPEMLVGAGTILTIEQVDQAIAAGSDFIVSPALNPVVVQYALDKGIPIIPGTNNPYTVDQAWQHGLKLVKLFPAEASGGVEMIKSLAAVYPVTFMPTGGITSANIQSYLAQKSVVACGGSWMVPGNLIESGQWQELGQLIREAVKVVHYV